VLLPTGLPTCAARISNRLVAIETQTARRLIPYKHFWFGRKWNESQGS